jgi:transcriptional regulator with XRE-family HTH domain
MKNTFGSYIKLRRKELGLPLKTVALHLNIDISTLGKIEKNERLINLEIQNTKDFKERKRDPKEIQKDLDLSNLKHKLIRGDIDAIEYNKRASYFMHDYSVDKTKNKKKN